MWLVIFDLLLVGGVVATVVCLVRTPDRDQYLAYPKEPERWFGATGKGAWPSLRLLSSPLFGSFVLAATGFVGLVFWLVGAAMDSVLVLTVTLSSGLVVALALAMTQLRHGPGMMHRVPKCRQQPRPSASGPRRRVLFVCGSLNQTTQMHQIAQELKNVEAYFTPHYCDHWLFVLVRKLGPLEPTIAGYKRRALCLAYLNEHGLAVDLHAERMSYDLVVTCNDQLPKTRNLGDTPQVLVQEGILAPAGAFFVWLYRHVPFMWRFVAGTISMGQSHAYRRFCVASEGYRDYFVAEGIPAEKLVATGIPNFDNLKQFDNNDFPYHDYVLLCTSDSRETGGPNDDRDALLKRAVAIARDRLLLVKLHPNEDAARATAEIHRTAPQAKVFHSGSAEAMVANCAVLITEWSSLTFVGVALDKEVYSYHDLDEIRRLVPMQHGKAAKEIAEVCHTVMREQLPARGDEHAL